jgi:hypothetical protein
MRVRNPETQLGIESFANAYRFGTGLFLAGVVLAIGVATLVMGDTLTRVIGLALLVLAAALVRVVRRP